MSVDSADSVSEVSATTPAPAAAAVADDAGKPRARATTGQLLSRYRLNEEVGQGGMAIVYRAQDTGLDREVAVKVLHPHLANLAESRARLEREAHAVAKLRHENILEIYDYSGASSTESFLVTEFIHGETLRQFLNAHPLTMPELAELIASEIARALEHAHSLGVIHRDIKPENVMIRRVDGVLKLMDFGIAQIVDKERMTMTGQLMGSPAYMAPEHIDGKTLDFRTDIFALGILTYQLATGQLPFRGRNPHEVLRKIADCKFQPPSQLNPKVGAKLEAVIARCLAKEPSARYPEVGQLRQDLLTDLSDAGLGDVRAELKDFFGDTDGYPARRMPEMVKALTARGRVLASSGRRAAALELWNRALNYAPGSSELKDAIAGLERRRSLARVAIGATALLAIGGGATWWTMQPTPPATLTPTPNLPPPPLPDPGPNQSMATPTNAPPSNPTTPTPAPTPLLRPTPRPSPLVNRRLLLAAAPLTATPTPTPGPSPTTGAMRTIEIVPTPKAVTIFLDGQKRGDYGPALTTLELAPGRHSLTLESPFCFPETREIAEKELGKIPIRLRWKPASITFKTVPENADIVIDGTTPAHPGQPLQLPIPERAADGRRVIKIHVSAAGHESQDFELPLRANDVRSHAVTLKPL